MKFFVPAIIALSTALAHADHGRDFLLLQDPYVPEMGSGFIYSNLSWKSDDGPDETSFALGFGTGIAPRTGLSLETVISEEGNGWDYSSITPTIQVDLTPKDSPVKFGILLGRDFALSSHHSGGHTHTIATVAPGIDLGPDYIPPSGASHTHGASTGGHIGIHQHGVDAWHARFITESSLGKDTRLLTNFIAFFPDEGNAALGYGIGIRHSFNHDFGIGLELSGDLSTHRYHEAVFGVYYSPVHSMTLKFGIGQGLNSFSSDLSLRTGLVWRF